MLKTPHMDVWAQEKEKEKMLQEAEAWIKHGMSDIRYKHDMSSIDGGKRYKVGNATALRISTRSNI